jgi:hypothetical protein
MWFRGTYPVSVQARLRPLEAIPDEAERLARKIELFRELDPAEWYAGWWARQFTLPIAGPMRLGAASGAVVEEQVRPEGEE